MIFCKAFARHPCNIGGWLTQTTPCCRECDQFSTCKNRCNNDPELCNKSDTKDSEQEEVKNGRVLKKVGQYDDAGNKVAVYRSVAKAAEAAGVSKHKMYSACDIGTKINGYSWRYEE